jgi:hypothetical protein
MTAEMVEPANGLVVSHNYLWAQEQVARMSEATWDRDNTTAAPGFR